MPSNSNFDVVIVGAGPAGITAAICLAKADFSVLVLEAGAFPGAENWSGAVYFAETLTRPDVLGLDEIERGAIERRVVKRGAYVYNGHAMFGLAYRNARTFENCYTVLRPVFDHWLAEKAKRFGVNVLAETTAESLICEGGRIIGVNTDRGPVYADCVFLAEGDASHLVTKEGYERLTNHQSPIPNLQPKFLQGIKEVVELDPSLIERNFGVGAGEAACIEIILRNGTIGNRPAKLNAGGFLYTNKESVSLGLVLPLDNLAHSFNGDHNRLMEWFKGLPEIQKWICGSQSVAYGAKVIRGGGYKELPQLVDDGLAIGGAATGIGIDFPYPNFTGPASAMGCLFAEALKKLRADGQPATKANLERYYEQPLRKTHYFKNVAFLRNWPGYVEHTSFFFGRQVDLICGALYTLSSPELHGFARWWQLAKFTRETLPLKRWGESFADLRKLNRAIPSARLAWRALPGAFGPFLLNTVWPFRRRALDSQLSTLDLSFSVQAKPVSWDAFPWLVRRLVRALSLGLPHAAHSLYYNDDTPIERKLETSLGHVLRNSNLWDILLAACVKGGLFILMPIQWACEMGRYALKRPTVEEYLKSFYQRWLALTRKIGKLDDGDVKIAQPWEDKLGTITYLSEKTSHIKVMRPSLFEKRAEIQKSPLWHICPAKVYECHTDDLGQSQVVVNFENCVKCESCWRGSEDAEWSRHRAHRLIYRTYTPAEEAVLELMINGETAKRRNGETVQWPSTINHQPLMDQLASKIREFSITLHHEPRDLDRNRVLWLQSIIQQEAEIAAQIPNPKSQIPNWDGLKQKLDSRIRHASHGKFFWAESDGQQLLAHHLRQAGISVEPNVRATSASRPALRKQIETAFTKQLVKALDHGADFTSEQSAFLKRLASIASKDAGNRKLVLEELGRVEPSAALLVSHHLIGCELLGRSTHSPWVAVARFDNKKAAFIPTGLAEEVLSVSGDELTLIHRSDLAVHRQQTFGLTAAALAHLEMRATPSKRTSKPGSTKHLQRLAANHLLSIALGASTMLVERTTAHALTRVQFPGLFKDENGRDGVGKFGAVKQFLSQMEAMRYVLDTLSAQPHSLTPEELKLITAEAFGTMPGSVTYNAGQIVGGPAFSEDDIYSKFYRDSGAWSWLWWDNSAANLDNFAASSLASLLPKILPIIETRNRQLRDAGIPCEKEVEIEKLLRSLSVPPSSIPHPPSSNLGADVLRYGYFDAPLRSPMPFTYDGFLHTEQRYAYGDFLIKPCDLSAPRYFPEQLHLDPDLRTYNERVRAYFRKNFADRTAEGMSYSRFIEKHHKVPEADIFALIDQGFLRMPIPKELGGEGLTKAHYYVLITNAMRYGEPGVSLTIQANTSIGTTPMLIGLKQDLPRARKDLEAFLKDDSAVVAIGKEIEHIQHMLNTPAVLKVKDVFVALGEKVKADIGKRPMLRSIASDFLGHFMQAARAGQRQDLKAFASGLEKARSVMSQFRPRAEAVLAELGRREEAHKYFLQLISSGQVAAFALTEPGAGSDSAGVQTRATLKQAEVFTDSDGVKFFHLDAEKKQRRNLVDMVKVSIEGRKLSYLGVELHWPHPGEGPAKPRWYEWKGRRVEFFDIGLIRQREGKEWFDYYELNGAKMWITNAHIAGVFALYAKTPEGVTGLMVDRFAEGMSVGKDEEKMGQRGSPTNELGLSSVRVPRECVIGIEGRGQVNALETLNVGRAGLCVSTVAMMLKIVEQTRAFVHEHGSKHGSSEAHLLPSIHQLLGAMTEELYATESVAYELIGLFDHMGTESSRMESAIGKYYGSEALHRVIRWAEAIHGCHSQTAQYEIEKHRRDARVLNIYEGTNEVQRFLMLKDLAGELFTKWTDETFVGGAHPRLASEVATLRDAKRKLRQRLGEVLQVFGQQIWQNTGFQAAFFKLCDMAGFIKVMESTLRRTHWLLNNIDDDAPAEDVRHRERAVETTASYVQRVGAELHALDAGLAAEFDLLRKGIYPPNIRVATLVFEEHEHPHGADAGGASELASHLEGKLRIAVLLKPVPLLSPRPHVRDGKLLETHFEMNSFDRGALIETLRLKQAAPDRVHVTVVSAGPAYARELLQQALAMGVDEAVWVDAGSAQLDSAGAARMLADALREGKPQLILAGSRATDPIQGVVGALVADDLHIGCVPCVTRLTQAGSGSFTLEVEQIPGVPVTKNGPLLVTWATPAPRPVRGSLDHFSMEGYLRSFVKPLRVVHPSAVSGNGDTLLRLPQAAPPSDEDKGARTPDGAAKFMARAAGIELAGVGGERPSFTGDITRRSPQQMVWNDCVVFLAEPPTDGFSAAALQSLDVAVGLARHLHLPLRAIVLTHGDEACLRAWTSALTAHGPDEIVFVTSGKFAGAVETVYLEAVQKLWNAENHPRCVVGPAWARELLARFANQADDGNGRLHVRPNIKEIVAQNGSLDFIAPAFGGRVETVQRESAQSSATEIITLAAGATFTPVAAQRPLPHSIGVTQVAVDLSYDLSKDEVAKLLKDVARAAGVESVKDAEFIVDVGYAIANKENYEVVIPPLKKLLDEIGVKGVQIGGSRKVVEELKLLRADQQIGQTGVSVNPTV
jgi:electron transfer flavoprotein-quinone oxidoreductase